jgi:hypothetical protein
MSEQRKIEEESVRRNAFSLALWEGKTDAEADVKAELALEEYRKERE